MKKKFDRIKESNFLKSVILLMTGAAGAQLITISSSPFITRIYGPEAFGMLGVFNAMIMIIGPISSLSYPIAIVLPKKIEEARDIVRLSFYLTIFMSLISFVTVILFNDFIATIFNLTSIKSFLYLIPIVILFSGISQIMEQWLIRTGQFKVTAKAIVLQALLTNVSKILIGILKPIGAILIIIQTISIGLKAYLLNWFKSEKVSMKTQEKDSNKYHENLKIARKYYDFPLYRTPQVLLNGISLSLPILMLTMFFGPVPAGYFTLSRTVLSAPVQLIGKSVSDVFYPRVSKALNKKEDITGLLLKATITLSAIGIIPFGIIALYGPQIFSYVFGEEWRIAGEYSRWMTIWIFASFINRPSVMTLPVLNAQVFHLIFTITMLTTNGLVLYLGYYVYHSALVSVKLVGITGGLFSLILIIITIALSRANIKRRN